MSVDTIPMMTEQEKKDATEILARWIGWDDSYYWRGNWYSRSIPDDCDSMFIFSPCDSEDDFRIVLDNVLEDDKLSEAFAHEVVYGNPHNINKATHMVTHWMKSTLEQRVSALLPLLDSPAEKS